MITCASYFSGAGLLDVGLRQAGIDVTQAYELDLDAVKTYRANLGDHIKHCDIASELVLDKSDVDMMAFTYPCTKYSTAANVHGTRTGDELYLHALRHLVIAEPEMFVVENVTGMRAFPIVMEAMTKLPMYYIYVFCPVDTRSWLPQRRDRLIIFGTRKPFEVRPPTGHRPVTLAEIVEHDPQVSIPKTVYARMNGKYRDLPIISDPSKGDIAPTVVSHYEKDKSTRLLADKRFPLGVRPYTVREYARLQGLPDSFTFPVSDTRAYRQIGNGVPVPMGRWIGEEATRYFVRYRPAMRSAS